MKNIMECKRKLILNYFDHEFPKDQPQDHTCSDFHNAQELKQRRRQRQRKRHLKI